MKKKKIKNKRVIMVRKFKGDGGVNKKGKRKNRGAKSKKREKEINFNRPHF